MRVEAVAEGFLFPVAAAQAGVDPVLHLAAHGTHLAVAGLAGDGLEGGIQCVEGDPGDFVGQRRGRRHQLAGTGLYLPQAGGVGGADRHHPAVQAQLAVVEHHFMRRLWAVPQPDAAAVHQHVVVGMDAALVRTQVRSFGGQCRGNEQGGQQGQGGQ